VALRDTLRLHPTGNFLHLPKENDRVLWQAVEQDQCIEEDMRKTGRFSNESKILCKGLTITKRFGVRGKEKKNDKNRKWGKKIEKNACKAKKSKKDIHARGENIISHAGCCFTSSARARIW